MNNKTGILILHGIGEQKKDYSMKLQQGIEEKLYNSNTAIVFQEVLYTDIFDEVRKRSEKLLDSSYKWQLLTRYIRHLFIYFLGDAASYKDKKGYVAVHQHLSDEIEALKQKLDANSPIIIVAHSLGAIIISDYVYDEQQGIGIQKTALANDLQAFVTFGCNIPLFETGHKKTVSIKQPNNAFKWLNFFSPFDPLGYRMEGYYDEEQINTNIPPKFITDIEVFPGGLLASWNFFSHISYWQCKEIHTAIAELV